MTEKDRLLALSVVLLSIGCTQSPQPLPTEISSPYPTKTFEPPPTLTPEPTPTSLFPLEGRCKVGDEYIMPPLVWPYTLSAQRFAYDLNLPVNEIGQHPGIDLAQKEGSPVLASVSGKILYTDPDWSGGQRVVLEAHGKNKYGREEYWSFQYRHLSQILVEEGELVVQGHEIGKVGSTGNSTGPHLHFEVNYTTFPDEEWETLSHDGYLLQGIYDTIGGNINLTSRFLLTPPYPEIYSMSLEGALTSIDQVREWANGSTKNVWLRINPETILRDGCE